MNSARELEIAPFGTCTHPGCLQPLGPTNQSRVCRMHTHQEACRCPACSGSVHPPQPKPGLKTVHVPYPTSNSGVALTAPVTLRKAPWDE